MLYPGNILSCILHQLCEIIENAVIAEENRNNKLEIKTRRDKSLTAQGWDCQKDDPQRDENSRSQGSAQPGRAGGGGHWDRARTGWDRGITHTHKEREVTVHKSQCQKQHKMTTVKGKGSEEYRQTIANTFTANSNTHIHLFIDHVQLIGLKWSKTLILPLEYRQSLSFDKIIFPGDWSNSKYLYILHLLLIEQKKYF